MSSTTAEQFFTGRRLQESVDFAYANARREVYDLEQVGVVPQRTAQQLRVLAVFDLAEQELRAFRHAAHPR